MQRGCGLSPDPHELTSWLEDRLPDGWFEDRPELRLDREEILVLGRLAAPDPGEQADAKVATVGCIEAFRDRTRDQRVAIAQEAEVVWERKLSWGVTCGAVVTTFTTVSTPVMTRLRMEERAVLDLLIDAGVARSRSEALAWCVRLVAKHEGDWIAELRAAVEHVQRARAAGPEA